MALTASDPGDELTSLGAFAWGIRSVTRSVLTLVLFSTYLGIGALAHDSHFSLGWVLLSTLLIWAGPAQIILISTLGRAPRFRRRRLRWRSAPSGCFRWLFRCCQ